MSNLYLHKVKKFIFSTIKDTIILDLDKVYYGNEYEKNFLKKHPKHLKIVSSDLVDFWKYDFHFWSFPVEDISICTNLITYARPFCGFYNATNLKVEENVKKVRMIDTLRLSEIQTITIPFTINDFKNNCSTIKNKLKTLIIYNNKDSLAIDLDKNFYGNEIIVEAYNTGDCLNIKTSSNDNIIEYNVYLKDDKLEFTKKYLKYQINASEYDSDTEELNIIKLKDKYNEISFKEYFYYIKKVILSKDDYKFLDVINKNNLKELIIKDENDMSLFPKTITINSDKGRFKEIEVFDNRIYVNIEKEDKTNRYILINDDLTYIDFETEKLNKVYLDFDAKNFKLKEEDGLYNLTIPFYKNFNLKDSKILEFLVNNSKYIYVRNKEDILMPYFFPTKDEIFNIINIERNNRRNFITENSLYSLTVQSSYNFDEEDNRYKKSYVKIDKSINKPKENPKRLIKW